MRLAFNGRPGLLLGLVLGGDGVAAQGTGRSLDIQPGGRQNGMGAAGVALADDADGRHLVESRGPGVRGRTSAVELTYAQLVPGPGERRELQLPHLRSSAPGLGRVRRSASCSSPTGRARARTRSAIRPARSARTSSRPRSTTAPSSCPISRWAPRSSASASSSRRSRQSGVGTTFGLDLAALYKIPAAAPRTSASTSRTWGPASPFINEDKADPLARNVKVGVAWEAVASKEFTVTLAVGDFNQSLVTNDVLRSYHGGLELGYTDQVAGRVGYYSDPLGEHRGHDLRNRRPAQGTDARLRQHSAGEGLRPPNVQKITLGYRF